jgi:hypothetical protein
MPQTEPQASKTFCFCTYASDAIYRSLAKELLNDMKKFAPGIPCIVFTDKPSDFGEFKTIDDILIFKHRQQGVLCYHERRFAIAKALTLFDSCMYLDADLRICAPIPPDMQWLPGITARSCTRMIKHIRERIDAAGTARSTAIKNFEFYRNMADRLNLDIEADNITFVNEFLFVVTRDAGKEIEWLKLWGKLSLYAELSHHHKHPAFAMGLAAAKVGFPIRHDVMQGIDFFDDRIERVRIAKGESDPNAKSAYFETQKRLENPQYSILQKALIKISKRIEYYFHSIRLKVTTLNDDSNFYRQ